MSFLFTSIGIGYLCDLCNEAEKRIRNWKPGPINVHTFEFILLVERVVEVVCFCFNTARVLFIIIRYGEGC